MIRTQFTTKSGSGRGNVYDHHKNATDNVSTGTIKLGDSLM
jgi:hypothetical protein